MNSKILPVLFIATETIRKAVQADGVLRASNAEFSICACSVQMVVTCRCLKKNGSLYKERRVVEDGLELCGK